MSANYAGNPANFPANIRLMTDDDPQRAQTYNPGLQDLADRTATLEASPLKQAGTFADMLLFASATSGVTVYTTYERGDYLYDATLSAFASPYTVASSVVGGGWRLLLNNALFDPTLVAANTFKVKPSLLRVQTIDTQIARTTNKVNLALSPPDWQLVYAQGGTGEYLQIHRTDGAPGDILDIHAGPLVLHTTGTDDAYLALIVAQTNSSAPLSTTYYVQGEMSLGVTGKWQFHWDVKHRLAGTGAEFWIGLGLKAHSGSTSVLVTTPGGAEASYGDGGYQWLNYSILREAP
jgi:hypothetical protein